MILPEPVLVGFFPKLTALSDATINAPGAVRIASVSNCISDGPPEWIHAWQHNDLGLYPSESVATGIAAKLCPDCDLYAYEVYPVRWHEDGDEPWTTAVVVDGSIPQVFRFLGFDVVTRDLTDFFECSPLSCNGAFEEFAVNEECLLATEEAAVEAAERIGRTQSYEPGYCHIVRVYRKRS